MRLTILEFAPCIDWLYHFRCDSEEGYLAGDGQSLSIRTGAKLRPRVVSVYAGGKATNVARVIDRLLGEDDRVEVELVVFRPDSAEGRYIHELQQNALDRVRVRPVLIEGQARLCVDMVDPATPPEERVEFNVSPRAIWTEQALAKALQCASELSSELGGDLLLMAGNPPLLESTAELIFDLQARVIEQVRDRFSIISVDTEKQTLANCLQLSAPPEVIKINETEYRSVDDALWREYAGTLVVTDRQGCRVTEAGRPPQRVRGAAVEVLYSTLGAGDAVHAAFTVARWVRGFDAVRAARYGQAAAAAAVSMPEGTRGITRHRVEDFYNRLQDEEGEP